MDIYKSLDISNGTVMKNPEMLKFISDHLKTKKMCKHAVENYVIHYDILLINILENGGTLRSVPGCHKNQKMCNKAVDNYHHALEFVPECYKAQKCVKLLILTLLQ